ncbi:hypothetical protein [Bacteroides sp. 519]|uniref:hypothetical protein n=1 Tax=Bacteroides sp. 519 TaxID=2302937 RepID=UPI0019402BED|nr:hypothetical protein [Bacteroides sp. 519]NDV58470.1 hypothetical protein [Bacteroides sp. 519]
MFRIVEGIRPVAAGVIITYIIYCAIRTVKKVVVVSFCDLSISDIGQEYLKIVYGPKNVSVAEYQKSFFKSRKVA